MPLHDSHNYNPNSLCVKHGDSQPDSQNPASPKGRQAKAKLKLELWQNKNLNDIPSLNYAYQLYCCGNAISDGASEDLADKIMTCVSRFVTPEMCLCDVLPFIQRLTQLNYEQREVLLADIENDENEVLSSYFTSRFSPF
jgi:hypothetical protein